ncbi:unnamed protein product [Rhizopus microsporus]
MAAIYLGFPLTSSSTQLSTFLDELLSSTRLTAHRLASRRLSIQERGLIAITLILNRIWHCLCVLVVSFDTCQRYRKEGGLAVLDPDTQLHALQLCWLRSLVQPDTESNYKYSFTLQVLQHCLYSFFGSPSPILPLAFAELRSPDVKPMGCCRLLFQVINMLDFSVNWETLSILLALEIPISRIYLDLLTWNGRGRRKKLGSTADEGCLRI